MQEFMPEFMLEIHLKMPPQVHSGTEKSNPGWLYCSGPDAAQIKCTAHIEDT